MAKRTKKPNKVKPAANSERGRLLVLEESNQSQIQAVAEVVLGVERRLSAQFREELSVGLGTLTAAVRLNSTDIKRLDSSVQGLDTRVGRVETSVQGLDTRVGHLETSVQGLDTRVSHLETSVQRIDAKVEHLDAKVQHLDAKVERVDATVQRIDARVERMDKKLDLKANREDLAALAERVSAL